MKYTNNHKLPEYVYKWLIRDEYDHDSSTISATGLLKPAKASYLTKLHKDELEMDCTDLVASRYGTALHNSFEEIELGEIQEERYYAEFNGFTISGKPDIVIDNVLHDIKSTSVWKFIKGDFQEYVKQLSIYRWLLWKNDIHLHAIGQICFLFTDWSKGKTKHDPTYPQCRVTVQDLHLWDYDMTEAFISERLLAIHNIDFENQPDCTKEELWAKDDEWAVKKKGAKRAIKLHKGLSQAQKALKEGQEIEYRPGKVVRCNYCQVRPFCDQFKKMEKEGIIAD